MTVSGSSVDVEAPAGAGPADGAGVLEPFLGRAHGELGLGRAVELPDGVPPGAGHDGALDRLGARCAGVGQEAQGVELLVGAEVGLLEDALQVGRDEEGGGRAVAAQRLEGGGGVEAAEDGERPARQQGAAGEADGDRVVHRRADHVQVIAVEVPDGGLVLEDLAGRRFVPQPRRDALGLPGRARRVVHGAGERMGRQVDGVAHALGGELGQIVLGEDADGRAGIGGEDVALGRGQRGVEQDRDEADAGGAQHRTDEVGRRAQGEGDPVAPGAALRPAARRRLGAGGPRRRPRAAAPRWGRPRAPGQDTCRRPCHAWPRWG